MLMDAHLSSQREDSPVPDIEATNLFHERNTAQCDPVLEESVDPQPQEVEEASADHHRSQSPRRRAFPAHALPKDTGRLIAVHPFDNNAVFLSRTLLSLPEALETVTNEVQYEVDKTSMTTTFHPLNPSQRDACTTSEKVVPTPSALRQRSPTNRQPSPTAGRQLKLTAGAAGVRQQQKRLRKEQQHTRARQMRAQASAPHPMELSSMPEEENNVCHTPATVVAREPHMLAVPLTSHYFLLSVENLDPHIRSSVMDVNNDNTSHHLSSAMRISLGEGMQLPQRGLIVVRLPEEPMGGGEPSPGASSQMVSSCLSRVVEGLPLKTFSGFTRDYSAATLRAFVPVLEELWSEKWRKSEASGKCFVPCRSNSRAAEGARSPSPTAAAGTPDEEVQPMHHTVRESSPEHVMWAEETSLERCYQQRLPHRLLVSSATEHAIWSLEVALPSMEVRVVPPAEFFTEAESKPSIVTEVWASGGGRPSSSIPRDQRSFSPTAEGIPMPLMGGTLGFVDGHFSVARFNRPASLCWHTQGANHNASDAVPTEMLSSLLSVSPCTRLFISDSGNHAIRVADFDSRLVRTVAGMDGVPGYRDGSATGSLLREATSMAWSASGLVFSDGPNAAIRLITGLEEAMTLPSVVDEQSSSSPLREGSPESGAGRASVGVWTIAGSPREDDGVVRDTSAGVSHHVHPSSLHYVDSTFPQQAQLGFPTDVAVVPSDGGGGAMVLFVDAPLHAVRVVDSSGVKTFVGPLDYTTEAGLTPMPPGLLFPQQLLACTLVKERAPLIRDPEDSLGPIAPQPYLHTASMVLFVVSAITSSISMLLPVPQDFVRRIAEEQDTETTATKKRSTQEEEQELLRLGVGSEGRRVLGEGGLPSVRRLVVPYSPGYDRAGSLDRGDEDRGAELQRQTAEHYIRLHFPWVLPSGAAQLEGTAIKHAYCCMSNGRATLTSDGMCPPCTPAGSAENVDFLFGIARDRSHSQQRSSSPSQRTPERATAMGEDGLSISPMSPPAKQQSLQAHSAALLPPDQSTSPRSTSTSTSTCGEDGPKESYDAHFSQLSSSAKEQHLLVCTDHEGSPDEIATNVHLRASPWKQGTTATHTPRSLTAHRLMKRPIGASTPLLKPGGQRLTTTSTAEKAVLKGGKGRSNPTQPGAYNDAVCGLNIVYDAFAQRTDPDSPLCFSFHATAVHQDASAAAVSRKKPTRSLTVLSFCRFLHHARYVIGLPCCREPAASPPLAMSVDGMFLPVRVEDWRTLVEVLHRCGVLTHGYHLLAHMSFSSFRRAVLFLTLWEDAILSGMKGGQSLQPDDALRAMDALPALDSLSEEDTVRAYKSAVSRAMARVPGLATHEGLQQWRPSTTTDCEAPVPAAVDEAALREGPLDVVSGSDSSSSSVSSPHISPIKPARAPPPNTRFFTLPSHNGGPSQSANPAPPDAGQAGLVDQLLKLMAMNETSMRQLFSAYSTSTQVRRSASYTVPQAAEKAAAASSTVSSFISSVAPKHSPALLEHVCDRTNTTVNTTMESIDSTETSPAISPNLQQDIIWKVRQLYCGSASANASLLKVASEGVRVVDYASFESLCKVLDIFPTMLQQSQVQRIYLCALLCPLLPTLSVHSCMAKDALEEHVVDRLTNRDVVLSRSGLPFLHFAEALLRLAAAVFSIGGAADGKTYPTLAAKWQALMLWINQQVRLGLTAKRSSAAKRRALALNRLCCTFPTDFKLFMVPSNTKKAS